MTSSIGRSKRGGAYQVDAMDDAPGVGHQAVDRQRILVVADARLTEGDQEQLGGCKGRYYEDVVVVIY